jgi:glucose-1-phosphate thymidylyltransferase
MGGLMKGIILAGGTGTRLWPISKSVNKHLLPIYDKPMIYYPISTLLLAGIVDICLITRPEDKEIFYNLLGHGDQWGVQFTYKIQDKPEGIAQAFLIARDFIEDEDVVLILGDNIFYGNGLINKIKQGVENLKTGFSSIYTYHVADPHRFGVVEFDSFGNVISIEEKPSEPKSNFVVTGIYIYTNDVIDIVKQLTPSKRGEFEITDLNSLYIAKGRLKSILLGRGFAWLDTGTFDSLLEAASFIATIEKIQGIKISVPEEIAFSLSLIDYEELIIASKRYGKSPYGKYIRNLVGNNEE